MSIHRYGLDIIRQSESLRLSPYQDSKKVWTIGWGHTGTINGRPVKGHPKLTREQAEEVFEADVQYFEDGVLDRIKVKDSDYQFAALVSLAFNIGLGAFGRSTLLRLFNEGNPEGAAREFKKWRRAGGEILSGLLTRRGREEQLFRMGS